MVGHDGGAIAACGNGRILAYLAGPDVRTLYAPTYSSPPLATLTWPRRVSDWIEDVQPWSAWTFDCPDTRLTVFAEADHPALTYLWSGTADGPVVRVDPDAGEAALDRAAWTARHDGAFLAEIPSGRRMFVYPSPRPRFVAAAGEGVSFRRRSPHELHLQLDAREGWFSLVGADSAREANEVVAHLRSEPVELRLRRAQRRRTARAGQLHAGPVDEPAARLVAQAGDQLLAQQSAAGGYIAGDRYPMSYLRDQYGTNAGLLSAGLTDSVESSLRFRHRKWRTYGDLANAETMNDDAIRHRHENDDVEQTGFFVLSVLDLAEAVGRDVLPDFADVVRWCLIRQHANLQNGMLPFNGDETYIAGGLLPRWTIEDGSVEATAIYASSIRRSLGRATELALPSSLRESLRSDLLEITSRFGSNFVRAGTVVTNSVLRRGPSERRHRTGVCESCGRFPRELERNGRDRYVCGLCDDTSLPERPASELSIPSATLMAISLARDLIPERLRPEAVDGADGSLRIRAERITGYDEALLALVLADRHPDAARSTLRRSLGRADRYGTWAEYYDGDAPVGARCRPWETGMNLLAVTTVLRSSVTPSGAPTASRRREP